MPSTLQRSSPALSGSNTRSRVRSRPILIGLVLLTAIVLALVAKARTEERIDREPLRVVDRAISRTGQTVGTISANRAALWSSGSRQPTESEVKEMAKAGNAYFEPIFFASHGSTSTSVDRCYYLPVQPHGGAFEPSQVSAVLQTCFLDPYRTPQSISLASVRRH